MACDSDMESVSGGEEAGAGARLAAAVSKLDRTQHIKTPSRGDATARAGEFDLTRSGAADLDVEQLVGSLDSSARLVNIGKSIMKTRESSRVLPKPLEKLQAERVKRSTGFESARKKLGRWDATVARSRTMDHISFPLKNIQNKLGVTKDYLSKLKLKSPLEQELEEVDPRPMGPVEEEEEPFPMTYQEMLEHRQELAKLRAQQSFKAAKDKRQSKIKSKKYHRILKKERMKLQLKEFEELQKTDPEEALKKLESLEKSRVQERHTLRHKNTGKWAKSKLIRAKYDKEVRQQLAEQLSVSRSLTHKAQTIESSDDESIVHEIIPDLPVSLDLSNPWMMKNPKKSTADFDFGYKKYLNTKISQNNDDSSSEDNGGGLETETNDKISKEVSTVQEAESDNENQFDSDCMGTVEHSENNDIDIKELQVQKEPVRIPQKKNTTNKAKPVATSPWVVETVYENKSIKSKEINKSSIESKKKDINNAFHTLESDISRKVQKKMNQLRNDIDKIDTKDKKKNKKDKEESDELSKLEFKSKKLRPILDTALNETKEKNPTSSNNEKSLEQLTETMRSTEIASTNIDPARFIAAKPKYLASALSSDANGYDNLDDEEQVVPKVNIEEVFEEDDVVASFRQEKEDEINKDKPSNIDLTLPGWGNWVGKGVKAPKRKRNRLIIKAAPKFPRRDENKGDIIIKEFKDPKLAVHKVTELPFPFTSVKDFEASIRAPLGNTFIPEIAHKKLIRPSVSTKAGTIIDPIDEDELLVQRNQSFKKKAIIALLGNK